MTYAVVSDIHGNYPALKAIMADAQMNGAHHFIFLGDYTNSIPFQNEVTETIRTLPNKTVIRSNHENYLIDFRDKPPVIPVPAFSLPLWWSYCRHTPENLDYLFNLPSIEQISNSIFLSHSVDTFFSPEHIMPFYPSHYKRKMEDEPFTHAAYLRIAAESIRSCPDAMANIRKLPKGVYLFGHNHLQFNAEIEGRLFVNPGSCGFPLDFDTRAAYSLLTRIDSNRWKVTERRVDYDKSEVFDAMRQTGFSEECPEFGAIYTKLLETGSDYLGLFIQHIQNTARMIGNDNPFGCAVWRQAIASFQF